MSNISREHFVMVQRLSLAWAMFDAIFISADLGMRKPELCFFNHVVQHAQVDASQMIMVDDRVENVCAASSLGMHGILVGGERGVGALLRSLLQDPLARAEAFLRENAQRLDSVVQGWEGDAVLRDNFAQLLILELMGDESLVYLRWPCGRTLGLGSEDEAARETEASARVDGNGNVLNGGINSTANSKAIEGDYGNTNTNGNTNGKAIERDYINTNSNGNTNDKAIQKDYSNTNSKAIETDYGKAIEKDYSNTHNPLAAEYLHVKTHLWNYFVQPSVLVSPDFPPDTDTTAIAYLSLPSQYLPTASQLELVMDAMATNLSPDGIMQTYFSRDRPRTTPEVCCNMLRFFHRFGHGSDARIQKTQAWVIQCLENDACRHGSRHYSTPETLLYFAARLRHESTSCLLGRKLGLVRECLQRRVNEPTNPLALAMRLHACQMVGVDAGLYKRDLHLLLSLQQEDGGWPAGHFCRVAKLGACIGNRGLTTALAVKIIEREKRPC
ncbi:hypothetical protein CDD81_1640 [Ophiocordyceps australis]|uniref:Uncharacterized protein n=1 Tax=Ophiocordyceps australis TaxID=1399860 RepID=A0A2C5XT65_9HYPO|nr:hypothetical protein CDD81_1640 [Ophiocordyceps australis]